MHGEVTQLLMQWSDGDSAALERLMPLIVSDLRRQASAYLRRERQGHTLQPTALVNEVFLKLVDHKEVRWTDRAHFFAAAANTMRRILVDHARAKAAYKRGGWGEKVELDEALLVAEKGQVDVLALDEALHELAALDERQCRVVELRFFAGLTQEETAEVLGVTRVTIARDWRNARAFLLRKLKKGEAG